MPRIKPEDKTPIVSVTFKLREDLERKVNVYAKFLDDSSPSYVVAAVVSDAIDGDKEFQKYLTAHPDAMNAAVKERTVGRGRPPKIHSHSA
jgi:hypothetical protein